MNSSNAKFRFLLCLPLTSLLLASFLFVGCQKPQTKVITAKSEETVSRPDFENTLQRFAKYESTHRRTFNAPNGPIHYLSWGEKGIPLFWLHGTYSSAYEFASFAERLAEQGYQVISVDWYGHGPTPIPRDDVTTQDWVEDLNALIEHLEHKSVILGGWSRGGMLAAFFYESFPSKVKALILADGGTWSVKELMDSMTDQQVRDLGKGLADKDGNVPAETFETKYDLFCRYSRPDSSDLPSFALLAKATQNEDQRWAIFSKKTLRWLRQHTTDAAFNGLRNPSSSSKFFEQCATIDPQKLFAKLNVPTLIIEPTADLMDSTKQNQNLKEQHPELIKHLIYEDSGHAVMASNPDRFLKDVSEFLSQVASGN